MATNIQVDVAREIDGCDYLELPSKATEASHPTYWSNTLPGTEAKEIEELHNEGVTQDAWPGTSGAGVWNLAIGTDRYGLPDGRVLGELAEVCFYANPEKGSVIARGKESIRKIADAHIEAVASRHAYSAQ